MFMPKLIAALAAGTMAAPGRRAARPAGGATGAAPRPDGLGAEAGLSHPRGRHAAAA